MEKSNLIPFLRPGLDILFVGLNPICSKLIVNRAEIERQTVPASTLANNPAGSAAGISPGVPIVGAGLIRRQQPQAERVRKAPELLCKLIQ